MRIKLLIICALLNIAHAFSQTGEEPTIVNEVLQVQFIGNFQGKTKQDIFNSIQNFINDWNSAAVDESMDKLSTKKKIKTEHANLEEGVATYNGKLFLGSRTDIAWAYITEANFTLDIKIKDNAALVTMKIPSFVYWANKFYHVYPTTEVLPKVTTKKHLYKDKKNLSEYGQLAPQKMKEFINALQNSINSKAIDF